VAIKKFEFTFTHKKKFEFTLYALTTQLFLISLTNVYIL